MKRDRDLEKNLSITNYYTCMHKTKTPGIFEIVQNYTPSFPIQYVTFTVGMDLTK